MANDDDKLHQELQKAADKMETLSNDQVKLAQKIASSDAKAKLKLLDTYQANLDALLKLQTQQNAMMKTIMRNMGA